MRTVIMTLAAATACSGGSPPCPFDGGYAVTGEMPNLEMQVGDTVETALLDYYNVKCDLPSYWWAARSTDSAAVVVSISRGHILTTAALEVADSVRVAVELNLDGEGIDDDFGDAYRYGHVFLVRVRPAGR